MSTKTKKKLFVLHFDRPFKSNVNDWIAFIICELTSNNITKLKSYKQYVLYQECGTSEYTDFSTNKPVIAIQHIFFKSWSCK